MFPFQLPDFKKRKDERSEHYEEFRQISGKSVRKSDFAFDDYAPSHNLRALIISAQERRSVDCANRRRQEEQKNKKCTSGRRRSGDGSCQPPNIFSINDETSAAPSISSPSPNPDINEDMTKEIDEAAQAEAAEQIDDEGTEDGAAKVESVAVVETEKEAGEPLFHICGLTVLPSNDQRTDELTRTESPLEKHEQNSKGAESSDPCEEKPESMNPPSQTQTPTEEQRFVDPMERLRRRTEWEIKESGSLAAAAASSSTSASLSFYGFPHKKSGENKYRRTLYEPRLHASEPLWVPTFQSRVDVMSQFAPYDERINNNSPEDWSVWEVLRGAGYPRSYSWIGSAIESRQKQKKRRGEIERWKHFIEAH